MTARCPWPAHDADLRRLWDTGMSARLIGIEVTALSGSETPVSKNSVVGRAHRLGLLGRPSPIVTHKTHVSRAVLRLIAADAKAAQALGRQWSATNEVSAFAPIVSTEPERRNTPHVSANVVAAVGRAHSYLAPTVTSNRHCLFPLWGNERPGRNPLFCKAARQIGKPYCCEHAKIAYRSERDERFENAA